VGAARGSKKKYPALVPALEEAVADATAGDPITGLRWAPKTTRNLAAALRRPGFPVSHSTVARLLRQRRYSLRTNRKRLARAHEPERDRQFRLLARRRQRFLRRGWPVIGVDTKKKEWVGNFKNPGACWRRQSLAVLDHDFPSAAVGRAIPSGVYHENRNLGYVPVGTSHETPAFAAAAIRAWWLESGRWCHPRARRLLIEADCGGANGNRSWAWKVGLQRLADEFGLAITVSHYPPGAPKWNWIEHRPFNRTSANWAGQPLLSYETVRNFIRTTTSETGLRCRAALDTTAYQTRVKISAQEKAAVRLQPHRTLPPWNYTIRPSNK
jgi:Rhodopirellula transposase DDE domain